MSHVAIHRRGFEIVALALAISASASLAEAQRPGGQGGGGMMNPQMQQMLLQRFDANQNGVLDPNEQQAAQQAIQQGGGMRGGQGMNGGQGGPGGGMGRQGGGMGMNNPQMQQMLLQRFDANQNGVLDPNEQQAARQAMQQGGGGRGMGGGPGMQGGPGMAGGPGMNGGPGGGAAGGGMMNSPQMQQQLLQRFDKNKNGKLDPDEEKAAEQATKMMQARGKQARKPPLNAEAQSIQTKGAADDKQVQMLKFDKNGDGKLDAEEAKAAREAK